MTKMDLEKILAKELAVDSGKIRAFNSDLSVVEVAHSCCEYGKITAWVEFFDFNGEVLKGNSPEVNAFRSWKATEWNRFIEIANREGIPAGIEQTAVI